MGGRWGECQRRKVEGCLPADWRGRGGETEVRVPGRTGLQTTGWESGRQRRRWGREDREGEERVDKGYGLRWNEGGDLVDESREQ